MTPLRALVLDCQRIAGLYPNDPAWQKIADFLESPQAIAALAADAAAGWQPIATAPTHYSHEGCLDATAEGVFVWNGERRGEAYFPSDTRYWLWTHGLECNPQPTHWMLLPAAPVQP